MTIFTSRWLTGLTDSAIKNVEPGTDRTDKSTSGGFVSSQVAPVSEKSDLAPAHTKSFEPITLHNYDSAESSETGDECSLWTDKTDKRSGGIEESLSRPNREDKVAWRVEAMKARLVDGVLPKILRVADLPETPGMCWSCGDPMWSYDETGKCVPCCLAAAQIVLEEIRKTKMIHIAANSAEAA